MKKEPLTIEQQDFIRANRLSMSMNQMCAHTGLGYTRLRGWMIDHDLMTTKEERQKWRKAQNLDLKKIRPIKWVKDPWKYGFNLVTMTPLRTHNI